GGGRRYGADELHRIALIRMWQDTGLMSLTEIGQVLNGTGVDVDWRTVVVTRIAAIDEQTRRLAAAKAHLQHLLICTRDNPADECRHLREVTTARLAGEWITPEELWQRTAHERA
ncbi:MerR family DNA-binding protein, partial [Kibdelosporangium lantanae]